MFFLFSFTEDKLSLNVSPHVTGQRTGSKWCNWSSRQLEVDVILMHTGTDTYWKNRLLYCLARWPIGYHKIPLLLFWPRHWSTWRFPFCFLHETDDTQQRDASFCRRLINYLNVSEVKGGAVSTEQNPKIQKSTSENNSEVNLGSRCDSVHRRLMKRKAGTLPASGKRKVAHYGFNCLCSWIISLGGTKYSP